MVVDRLLLNNWIVIIFMILIQMPSPMSGQNERMQNPFGIPRNGAE